MSSSLIASGFLRMCEKYGFILERMSDDGTIIYYAVPYKPTLNDVEKKNFTDIHSFMNRLQEVANDIFGIGKLTIKYRVKQ